MCLIVVSCADQRIGASGNVFVELSPSLHGGYSNHNACKTQIW